MTAPFGTKDKDRDDQERVRVQDHAGSLVILERTGVPIELATEYGDAVATPARLLNVDNDADGWLETLVFPSVIQDQISDEPRLGRVEKVTGKKRPYWHLADATEDDIKKGMAAWAKHDDSAPF